MMPMFALLLYVGWTIFLVFLQISYRGLFILSGERKMGQFKYTGEDLSPFSERLSRAHANCLENLPLFLGIVIAAHIHESLPILEALSPILLAARVFQSTVHMISTSALFVTLRFSGLFVQLSIMVYWIYLLASKSA